METFQGNDHHDPIAACRRDRPEDRTAPRLGPIGDEMQALGMFTQHLPGRILGTDAELIGVRHHEAGLIDQPQGFVHPVRIPHPG